MSGVRQPAWNEAESTRLVHGSRHRATRSVVLCAVSQAHAVRVVSHPGRHLVVPAARRYLTIEALEIEDEASMAAAADEYFGQLMDGATTAQPGTSATSTLLVLPAPPPVPGRPHRVTPADLLPHGDMGALQPSPCPTCWTLAWSQRTTTRPSTTRKQSD